MLESRIGKAQGVLPQLKQVWKNRRIEDKFANQDKNIISYSDDSGQMWP